MNMHESLIISIDRRQTLSIMRRLYRVPSLSSSTNFVTAKPTKSYTKIDRKHPQRKKWFIIKRLLLVWLSSFCANSQQAIPVRCEFATKKEYLKHVSFAASLQLPKKRKQTLITIVEGSIRFLIQKTIIFFLSLRSFSWSYSEL